MINSSLVLLAVSITSALVMSLPPRRRHPARRDTRCWDWDLQQMDGRKASPERGVIYIDSLKGHVGRTKR